MRVYLRGRRARCGRAVKREGCRRVRPPNDEQAAGPRITRAHDRQKTVPPAAVHVVRVADNLYNTPLACRRPQRLVHAPHPHLLPLHRRRRRRRLAREAVQRLAAA